MIMRLLHLLTYYASWQRSIYSALNELGGYVIDHFSECRQPLWLAGVAISLLITAYGALRCVFFVKYHICQH